MTQGERIREVRKALGLTLEKFGEKIGMKKNSVSQLENGKNSVTEQVIKLICREYNVDPTWLTTGEGEMFIESDNEFMARIDRIMAGEDEARKNLFKLMLELDDEDITALHNLMKKAIHFSKEHFDASKKKDSSAPSVTLNAAHDEGATTEQKEAADAIMMDDNEWN